MSELNEFTITGADWEKDRDSLLSVRHAVFVHEQKVPIEIEVDDGDPVSFHVLARDSSNRSIGTARISREGRIGRVAVLKEWRKQGVGTAVMRYRINHAKESRVSDRLMLHAQTWTIGFYESLGFVAEGEEFSEANIPHRTMILELK